MKIEFSRFAFDLGTNSIGWAIYRLDEHGRPCELIDCGVRLFADGRNPKDGQSLAAMRRMPRAARRRRDRYLQRRAWLMALLVRHGLMPADEKARKSLVALDPFEMRARAIDDQLTPFELGRALWHLNQRRGFKSNRIVESKDEKDKGKIASAGLALQEVMASRTLGQHYLELRKARKGVRARMNGEGAKAFYDLYPQRDMLEREFDLIWSAQSAHHRQLLTDEARDAIRNAIFHQRPLKAPVIGRCTFFPKEERLATAHPLAQRFRIYQELANIKVAEGLTPPRTLTMEERDLLSAPLLAGDNLKFGKVRKLLGLGGAAKINLEEGGREELKGDVSAARLGGSKGALKRLWPDLDEDRRVELIDRLLNDADDTALKGWIVSDLGATAEEADAAAAFRPIDGHIRLGQTATRAIVEVLKEGVAGAVVRYHEAVKLALPGSHHSDLRDGEVFDRLPDYRQVLERHTVGGTAKPEDPPEKRYGRVTNPTVHIGLNQLRRLMNALIDRYGPPTEVVLELARELKQTKEDKDRIQKENRKNEEANRQRIADLEAIGIVARPSDLRLYRLWEDLGPPTARFCTYTGRPISFAQVFSDEVEVEHILPFSRTLDDSMANKTLAFRDANRGKRNLAPEEADWSNVEGGYEAVQQRARDLPRNKRWRFLPGAMERYSSEERDFLARQLNETRHLSRLAREYVGKVVTDPNGVWVVTGSLTALLRARWGLNASNGKNRDNHRHHAIDATTIGVIDRGLLNELARRAGMRESDDRLDEIVKDVPQPPGFVAAGRDFRANVLERVAALIVSHKPEHGTGGALHEDTAYGLVGEERGEDGNLVYRKLFVALTANEVERIRDLDLRRRLADWLRENAVVVKDQKALSASLAEFAAREGQLRKDGASIRRVRILKKEESVILIKDANGLPYKALVPGENHHMDIVEGLDGIWRGFAATVFEANQKTAQPGWRRELPDARLVMRVHKGDLVELEDPDGIRRVKRIVQLKQKQRLLCLAPHDEGGDLAKRHNEPDDPFRWDFANIGKLKARQCRLLRVDEAGKINSHA